MKSIAHLAFGLLALNLFACGASADSEPDDESEGALERQRNAQPQTGDVELTVKAADSKAAEAFLKKFVEGFRDIIDIDRRDEGFDADRREWLSSEEELVAKVYKTKRNDGSIECNGITSCTFKLKRVEIVGGKPVSKGDRNYWGGTLFGKFVSYSGNMLDGNQSQMDSVVIGKAGTVPFIECKRAGQLPMGFGLSAEACTFNFKR